MFDAYLRQACLMVIVISGVPLIAASVSGLAVSLLQAVTQIQEQSISYLVRFVSVGAVMAVLFSYFASEILLFTQQLLSSIAVLGRMP